MSGDPLTDILTLAGARCLYTGSLAAGGDWALQFPPPGLVKLFAVVRGTGWLEVDGHGVPRLLAPGDVVMLPPERAFRLASDPALPGADGLRCFAEAVENRAVVGTGRDFLTIGGHVLLAEKGSELLRDFLPPLLHIAGQAPEAPAMRWLLDQLMDEVTSGRPGSVLASHQLAQLLFVQLVRSHLASSENAMPGRAAALADPRMAPVLRAMHAEPGRAWQVAELARVAGMSRTGFAVRFKEVAGVPPLTYLQDWRMRLAEHALRGSDVPIQELAFSLGYASESAFSTAFKRMNGMAPSHYRLVAGRVVSPAPSDAR